MVQINMRDDPHRFVNYYQNQVGGTLPGFYGAPVMYGRGIGSIFSKLFRFVAPLVKKGFAIAKPHLKTAATNIASDVIGGSSDRRSQAPKEAATMEVDHKEPSVAQGVSSPCAPTPNSGLCKTEGLTILHGMTIEFMLTVTKVTHANPMHDHAFTAFTGNQGFVMEPHMAPFRYKKKWQI